MPLSAKHLTLKNILSVQCSRTLHLGTTRFKKLRMPTKTYIYKEIAGSQPLELDVHYQAGGSNTPKPIGP